MGKSSIQRRAEKLAVEFREARLPALVIEFAGVPKAGKTSTLNQVYAFLRRCGFKCEVVVERASVCPIKDKKHFNFNIWTACTTLSQLLEKTQTPPRADDPDILFLDRGVFDAMCWLRLLERLGRIRADDRNKANAFLLTDDWTSRVTGVIAMSTKPADALERERGLLPVEGPGGSIMNPIVLEQMKRVIRTATEELKDKFKIFRVNTSAKPYIGDQKETCRAVTTKILDWVEGGLQEQILSAQREKFSLKGNLVLEHKQAKRWVKRFEELGDFRPRKRVEADITRIQPLPVVVVRNKSGKVLRLVRKEREARNRLHKKVTVWAGGHVRREDGRDGHAIETGAIRELQEELRIYATPEKLKLLGAVYAAVPGSTEKHMAFVYEWRAEGDDIEIALCNGEFIEKQGTSLQGAFLSAEKIMEESDGLEEWSKTILKDLILPGRSRKLAVAS